MTNETKSVGDPADFFTIAKFDVMCYNIKENHIYQLIGVFYGIYF